MIAKDTLNAGEADSKVLDALVNGLREDTEFGLDPAMFAAIIDSTGWTAQAEPQALSGIFLARAIYPRLSEICLRLGMIPFHETQVSKFLSTRPDGPITVKASYESAGKDRLRVDVQLSGTGRRVWMEGTISFRLFQLSGRDNIA